MIIDIIIHIILTGLLRALKDHKLENKWSKRKYIHIIVVVVIDYSNTNSNELWSHILLNDTKNVIKKRKWVCKSHTMWRVVST